MHNKGETMKSYSTQPPLTDFIVGAFSVLNIIAVSLAINVINTFITPQIAARLDDAQLDLPTSIQMILAISQRIGDYGLLIFMPITGVILLILAIKWPRSITSLLAISSTTITILFIFYSLVLLTTHAIALPH